jgi:hypothetical protein
VRSSYVNDVSLQWTRLNAVPDFVYFDHSIHVNKGIGCTTCHGQIGNMPLTYRANTLYMRWCIDCHKNPALHVRYRPDDPRQKDITRPDVFNPNYVEPLDQLAFGRQLVKEYKIKEPKLITDCYTCHRQEEAKIETRNWKLETRNWKLGTRKRVVEFSSFQFL